MRINLVGTFNVCRLVAAHIIANIKADAEKEGKSADPGFLIFCIGVFYRFLETKAKQLCDVEDPGVIINVASIAYTEG